MKALALHRLVLGSLVLRQPLLVVLLAAAACVHLFWGRGNLEDIIEDMWVGLDKEVILSIPLFILCGNVMTRGSIAQRLIRILSALTQPHAGRAGGRHHPLLRGVRAPSPARRSSPCWRSAP